jgi:pimeloyl-ACP methyl ester carboxylesterase
MTTPLPFLLVPGLLCDAALWTDQRWALGRDRPVQVVEHRTGSSIATIAAMALSAAPPRFALAGLSMGGYVALEMLRQAPERVERIALLDTNAHADPEDASARRRAQVTQAHSGGLDSVLDGLVSVLIAPANQAAIGPILRAMAHRSGVDVFARQQAAIIGRADQRDWLRSVRCPALILCGALDAVTPPAKHEEMAALIPGAELVIVSEAGHLAPLEAPTAVTDAMQAWLAR